MTSPLSQPPSFQPKTSIPSLISPLSLEESSSRDSTKTRKGTQIVADFIGSQSARHSYQVKTASLAKKELGAIEKPQKEERKAQFPPSSFSDLTRSAESLDPPKKSKAEKIAEIFRSVNDANAKGIKLFIQINEGKKRTTFKIVDNKKSRTLKTPLLAYFAKKSRTYSFQQFPQLQWEIERYVNQVFPSVRFSHVLHCTFDPFTPVTVKNQQVKEELPPHDFLMEFENQGKNYKRTYPNKIYSFETLREGDVTRLNANVLSDAFQNAILDLLESYLPVKKKKLTGIDKQTIKGWKNRVTYALRPAFGEHLNATLDHLESDPKSAANKRGKQIFAQFVLSFMNYISYLEGAIPPSLITKISEVLKEDAAQTLLINLFHQTIKTALEQKLRLAGPPSQICTIL